MKITVIHKKDKNFPQKLTNLHVVPQQIHIKSDDFKSLAELPSVGIVGSRKVSPYGRTVTNNFASYLARKGILIVSGLALGVDSLAHQAALDAGGKTLAILPSGINKIYPAAHFQLAQKIVTSGGGLISEYEDDALPLRHSFIERNRIIAAMSDVLLITEAAEKSGSLHTARFALDLGRPVLAVPGDIYSPMSAGTNNLIKMGAQLVNTEKDILDALGFSGKQLKLIDAYYPENQAEKAIIESLQGGVVDGAELLGKTNLDASQFSQTITMLEIKGIIGPLGNNQWHLR